MLPDEYCRNLAAPPGSDFHYSLLGLPLTRQRALIAVQAFYLEASRITEECHDPGVARTKHDWWRTELDRLFASHPQHPVTVALQPHLSAFNLQKVLFQDMLDGVVMDQDYTIYPSLAELTLYIHRNGSTPTLLMTEILGYNDTHATPRFAHEAGAALLLFDLLYNTRRHIHGGRCYFPEDDMQRFNVHPDDLLAAQTTESIRQLFAFQAKRIGEYYQRALDYLPPSDRYAQYSLLIRLDLAMTLLAELAEEGYRLLEQQTRLTPLRKLWLAWCLKRREQQRYRHLAKA
ncbi:MAG: squalene synthase HpnD [Candidatus Contendobacter odensis]|uniref:Squalene synthase HpnD n=1 Tax=Candidatus Contendibacter odensensis TaxID=1400860 RepID=A0A2G6PFW2_9GAMM|nr:MAG: squalene synthase HpnD [Candidatus Contendobacter odensis]